MKLITLTWPNGEQFDCNPDHIVKINNSPGGGSYVKFIDDREATPVSETRAEIRAKIED